MDLPMGDPDKQPTEEEMEKANDIRLSAGIVLLNIADFNHPPQSYCVEITLTPAFLNSPPLGNWPNMGAIASDPIILILLKMF